MSKPSVKITRTIQSEQVLNAFTQVVRRNLPLELKNTRISRDDIIYALAYANVHRLSIQSACQELKDAPPAIGCGNSGGSVAGPGRHATCIE